MVEARCPCPDETPLTIPGRAALAELVAVLRRPGAARHAVDDLRGLLAEVERQHGWQPAEHTGSAHPRGMQRVLDRYVRDTEAVRDELRAIVIEHIGDPGGGTRH